MENILRLVNVSKNRAAYGVKRRVLEEVNLSCSRGERISLVGPNGSGKTTLMRLMLGIEAPDSGTVECPLIGSGLKVSYIPQDYRNALFPWLALRKNLFLPEGTTTEMSGDLQNKIEDLSERFRVKLDFKKYPYQISGGEQQIFLLLRAILSRPDVIILDEPLSAVDLGRKRIIQGYLAEWMAEHDITLVFASHDFEEAVLLADRVIILAHDSATIKHDLKINLPWPRTMAMRESEEFKRSLMVIIDELV
jgi:NitT/TauT family transport system ATP-binding protein